MKKVTIYLFYIFILFQFIVLYSILFYCGGAALTEKKYWKMFNYWPEKILSVKLWL